MSSRRNLVYFGVAFWIMVATDALETDFVPHNCSHSETKNNKTYRGWPFDFSCGRMAKKSRRILVKGGNSYAHNSSCTVQNMSDGTLVWKSKSLPIKSFERANSFNLDISESDIRNFQMIFQVPFLNICYYENIYSVAPPSDMACEDFINDTYIRSQVSVGGLISMKCDVPKYQYPGLALKEKHLADASYEWTFNCSRKLPSNAILTGNRMIISKAIFANAGIYACAVTYKNRTRYIDKADLCVRHSITSGALYTMKCPEVVESRVGKNVSLTCSIDLGTGGTILFFSLPIWKKKNSTGSSNVFEEYCDASYDVAATSTINPRATCASASTIPEKKCYFYEPPPEEQLPPRDIVDSSLTITNLDASDFGDYQLTYLTWGGPVLTENVTLVMNSDPELQHQARTIGIVVGIICLLILLLILCLCRKYDVLWLTKKCCGTYEEAHLPYTAYLAYYYSKDGDKMSENSRNMTQNLIGELHDALANMGMTAYDENREETGNKFEVENIVEIQKKCSRIIIILNDEYTQDHWSVHKAYRALNNMVQLGTPVIFITMPGITRKLKQLPTEAKTTLKKAMRLSMEIQWSGKVPLSGSFLRKLEYCMPKIRPDQGEKDAVVFVNNATNDSDDAAVLI